MIHSSKRWILTFLFLTLAFVFFISILILLLFYSSHSINPTNASQFNQKRTLQNPTIQQSIHKITQTKKQIQLWEQANYPKIKTDAFNPLAQNSLQTPTQGGKIRVRLSSEPRILSTYLDNSATTSLITGYIFDSLLDRNPETFQYEPSLATHFIKEDVVWLKGPSNKINPFAEKENNRFLIGKINLSRLPENHSKIQKISIQLSNGSIKVIPKKQLRLKSNSKNTYTRPYDLGVVFTFQLQTKVLWHDGQPFTADDVIFTLNLIKNPYIPQLSHLRSYYQNLKSFQKIGPYQVKLYFDTQYFKSFEMASSFPILPKHIFLSKQQSLSQQELSRHFIDHPANRAPIGTGPYYLAKNAWQPKEKISLTRYDSYFNPNKKAYLKKIIFQFIPNQDSAFIAFKNGQIDFLTGLTSEQFFNTDLSKKAQKQWIRAFFYTGGFSYIGYNTKKITLQDQNVRKAITLLLNRQYILNHLFFGLGHVVSGPQYFFGPAYNHAIQPHPYNRQKAISLLNQAGWIDTNQDGIRDKNGIPLKLEMIYPQGSSTATAINSFLFEELASLGIFLKLTRLEWSVFIKNLTDRQFDLCILGWQTPIESDPYQIWHSSQWDNQGSNHVGFQNQQADQIIEQARYTLNPQKRYKLFFQLHKILHNKQPYLFLFTLPTKAIYHSRFRNVQFYRVNPGFNLNQWFVPKHLQTSYKKQ